MSNQSRSKKWKHPRDNQVKIEKWRETVTVIKKPTFFTSGETKSESELVSMPLDMTSDEEAGVIRTFIHLCGLIKAVTLCGPERSRMLLYFDGCKAKEIAVDKVEMQISPDVVTPTAEICFKGEGPRYGRLERYEISRITLSFMDRQQMLAYVSEERIAAPPPLIPTVPDSINIRSYEFGVRD